MHLRSNSTLINLGLRSHIQRDSLNCGNKRYKSPITSFENEMSELSLKNDFFATKQEPEEKVLTVRLQ